MPLWSLFITEETESGAGKYLVPGLHSSEVAEPDGDLDGLRTGALSQVFVGPFIPLYFKTVIFHCSHSIFSSSPQSRHHFHHPGPSRCTVRRVPCCGAKTRGLDTSGLGAVLPGAACGTGEESLLQASGRKRSAVGGPGGQKLGRAEQPAENIFTPTLPSPPPASNTHTLTCSLWVSGSGPRGL